MFGISICASFSSVSDEEQTYTVLKNLTIKLMLSLDSRKYSFSATSQSLSLTHVRLYLTDDKFDNFPLMADKIWVRSTYKGFVVQLNDEAMKRCLYSDF